MDDRQRQFVDFVDKLSLPMTVCQMKQATRQWVESALEGEDFVTMVRVRDAMEAEWERAVDDQLVLDSFCDPATHWALDVLHACRRSRLAAYGDTAGTRSPQGRR